MTITELIDNIEVMLDDLAATGDMEGADNLSKTLWDLGNAVRLRSIGIMSRLNGYTQKAIETESISDELFSRLRK